LSASNEQHYFVPCFLSLLETSKDYFEVQNSNVGAESIQDTATVEAGPAFGVNNARWKAGILCNYVVPLADD
jgi:hypothetical protein